MKKYLVLLSLSFFFVFNSNAQELLISPKSVIDKDMIYAENGFLGPIFRRNGEKLSSTAIQTILANANFSESIKQYRRGRTQNIVGNIIGIPSRVIVGYELYNELSDNRDTNTGLLIGSIAGTVVASIFSAVGINNMRNSVRPYNDMMLMQFTGTKNGIGLVLQF